MQKSKEKPQRKNKQRSMHTARTVVRGYHKFKIKNGALIRRFLLSVFIQKSFLAKHSQTEEAVHLSQQNQHHHYRSDKFDTEIVESFGLELSTI